MTQEQRDELGGVTGEDEVDLRRWLDNGCPPTALPDDLDAFIEAAFRQRVRRIALGVDDDIDEEIAAADRVGREERYWVGAVTTAKARELRTQRRRTLGAIAYAKREVRALLTLEKARPQNEPSTAAKLARAYGRAPRPAMPSDEGRRLARLLVEMESTGTALSAWIERTRRPPNAPAADRRIVAVEAYCRRRGITSVTEIARVLLHEGLETVEAKSDEAENEGAERVRQVAERVRARLKRRLRRGR